MKHIFSLSSIIVLVFACNAVLAQNKKEVKSITPGWNISDMEAFGFNNPKQLPGIGPGSKNLPEGCVYISGGTFTTGNHYPMAYTFDDSTLWAESGPGRIAVGSYIMKETEVTNKEYREFVNWVRDSIARELLFNSDNPAAKFYKKVDEDGNVTGLDWNEPIDWSDTISLAPMFFPLDERFFSKKIEFDVRVFKYKMDDTIVSVYPDTLCWIMDFPYFFNKPFTVKYFWHHDFDNYPVAGVSLEQAKAFCHWKTKMEWNGNLPLGYFRLPTAAEYEFAALHPSDEMNNERYHNKEYMTFSGNKLDSYNYLIGWNNLDSIETNIPKKEKQRKKYYQRVLKNNTTFLTNFNTWGVISENGMVIVNNNADGFLYTSPAGFYRKNYEGLYDLQGNVAEWTSSVFIPGNIITISLANLSSFMNVNYNYISNNKLPDSIKARIYNAKNSIEFLKALQVLNIKSSRSVKKKVTPEPDTKPDGNKIKDDDGKIRFIDKFGTPAKPAYEIVFDSDLSITLGKTFYKYEKVDSLYNITIPVNSISDRNWLEKHINTSMEEIAKTIADREERNDYYKSIRNETHHLFLALNHIDEMLNRAQKFKGRFIVKGGSWAHTIDHTNPFIDHCFQAEQAHCFIGFRYAATVLGPPNYHNKK